MFLCVIALQKGIWEHVQHVHVFNEILWYIPVHNVRDTAKVIFSSR